MPVTDLKQDAMLRLVGSEAWGHFVRYLVEQFELVEQVYDASCAPKDQGLKQALRLCIETPYKVAEVESPLTRKFEGVLAPLKRNRRTRQKKVAPLPLSVPVRSSHLV